MARFPAMETVQLTMTPRELQWYMVRAIRAYTEAISKYASTPFASDLNFPEDMDQAAKNVITNVVWEHAGPRES